MNVAVLDKKPVLSRFFVLMLVAVFSWQCFHLPVRTMAQDAPAANAAEPEQPKQNMLTWIVHVSGIIGLVIFALSFYFVAVVIQQFLELRPDIVAPPEIIAECKKLVEQKDLQKAYDLLSTDDSFFSRSLCAGIEDLPHGADEAREKLERKADTMVSGMERKISILAVLGTLGPMIGLLGTLKGMIASFSVIAISGTQLKASEVAGGISEALVLTFEGVLLSVPAIYFYSVFKNRITTLTAETTMMADDHLRAFARLMRPAK